MIGDGWRDDECPALAPSKPLDPAKIGYGVSYSGMDIITGSVQHLNF
jgi:hypothetical protein